MPLGMEDKRIREGDISASSYYNANLAPWFGRLNHLYAWMARTRNTKQWLKINFGYVTQFRGIASQGRSNSNQWVTSYVVTFSRYGNTYVTYKENKRVKVSAAGDLQWKRSKHLAFADEVVFSFSLERPSWQLTFWTDQRRSSICFNGARLHF